MLSHMFLHEAIVAFSVYSLSVTGKSVLADFAVRNSESLARSLSDEFVPLSQNYERSDAESTLENMITEGSLGRNDDGTLVISNYQYVKMLANMMAPFVECNFVVAEIARKNGLTETTPKAVLSEISNLNAKHPFSIMFTKSMIISSI